MAPAAGRVVVVGLGPGDAGSLTRAATSAIEAIPVRFVRTTRHPTSAVVTGAVSFDDRYEAASSMEEVYAGIAATLVDAARRHGEVLYAVPGSPLVAERTVELLRADAGVEVEIVPALSFLDLAWARLGVDPVAAGVRLVDGHRFALDAAGSTGPLLVAQCDRLAVLSEIKLAVEADPGPVVVLQRLGLPDEVVTEVAWEDLDRGGGVEPDHLTCVWIPALAEPVAAETARLVELMRTLRQRCPWDRVQSHRSLRRHLLEETYEVLDAIDGLPAAPAGPDESVEAAPWGHLEEELGDLLFQVVFHAHLAEEVGQFGFADVARGVHDKLVARHPHVFGGGSGGGGGPGLVAALESTWEQRKREEKGRTSVTDGVPPTLPALMLAEKLQRRATGLGLDWAGAEAVWPVVAGELDELRAAVGRAGGGSGGVSGGFSGGGGPGAEVVAELGDVLFSVVNLARKLGVEPELALRGSSERFRRRVVALEALAGGRGLDHRTLAGLDPAAVDDLWREAKRTAG